MTKGGYQIIDLKDVKLTLGTGVTFKGVYNQIKGTRKAILVSGLNIAGTEYHDTFVDFTVSSTTYTGTIYGKTITVTNEDLVTVANPT